MPIKVINLGQYANDGTGDDLREAFSKVNDNFALLTENPNISNGTNLGIDSGGTAIFAQRNLANLEFKSIKSSDNTITITPSPTTVDIKSKTILLNDPLPKLSTDLDLNGHNVIKGDVQTTVFGISVPFINQLITLAFASNQLSIDLGSITNPTGGGATGYDLDFGEFAGPYNFQQNNLDFGSI